MSKLWNMPGRTPDQGLAQLPRKIVVDGFWVFTNALNAEALDAEGWNEAVPVKREDYTNYATRWVKGDDLVYREEIVSQAVDETARDLALAREVRTRRDSLLAAADWTQLKDAGLDAEDMVLWQSYRQALRDVPQQPGFPASVDWPDQPAAE